MDVNQIFKDLGQMIHDQGAVVDSIESSVEHASQDVEAGTQELHQAVNYQVRIINPQNFCFVLALINKKLVSLKTRLSTHFLIAYSLTILLFVTWQI